MPNKVADTNCSSAKLLAAISRLKTADESLRGSSRKVIGPIKMTA